MEEQKDVLNPPLTYHHLSHVYLSCAWEIRKQKREIKGAKKGKEKGTLSKGVKEC